MSDRGLWGWKKDEQKEIKQKQTFGGLLGVISFFENKEKISLMHITKKMFDVFLMFPKGKQLSI